MKIRRCFTLPLIALALAGPALALSPVNKTLFGGLAIEGYDPVAYFTEGRPVEGSREHVFDWNGATWRVASAAHRELFVQAGHTHLGQPLLPARSHRRVGGREGPPVQHRLDVEHGAADDDRHRAARRDGLDVGYGSLLVARHGRGFGDVQNVEPVVRDAAPVGDRQLGGADVHAPVLLHGVGVDDLPAEAFGDLECEMRLAGAGGSDDRDRPGPIPRVASLLPAAYFSRVASLLPAGHGAQAPTK